MNKDPDNRELEHRFELLKKDYKIMEANIDGTLKDMRTDIERNNTAIERNNTTVANRIHTQSKWIMGMALGVIVLIIGMAGLFLQVLTTTS